MERGEIEMLLSELERFLDEGALADYGVRVEMRRYLKGIDQEGPGSHPEFAQAVRDHPRSGEMLDVLGWRERPTSTPVTNAEVDRARTVLDRIERLIEAGAREKPEPRARLRRLLKNLGPTDPVSSPVFHRALEKRARRVELMRILEWRNSGEPPLRAQPVQRGKRACPYCGKVFLAPHSIGQCPQCGNVSEVIAAE